MSGETPATGRSVGPAPILLDLLVSELRSNASEAEEHGLFRSVGARLARQTPLTGDGDLSKLEKDINQALNAAGIGVARLTVARGGIVIRHHLFPAAGDDGASWPEVLPAVLEGLYDGWLRSLGSGPRLRTTIAARDGDVIELYHGP